MTIKQIEYFLEICELTQVNECAKKMGISQSALSIAIKNLETSLGGSLFDRRSKSLVLNERGRAFKNAIIPVYERIFEIEKDMKNLSMFNIKVFCSLNIGNYLLPPVLDEILEEKSIRLDLSLKNTSEITEAILSNHCDLGIVEGRIHTSDLCVEKICEDELIVVTGNKEFAKKEYFIDEISDLAWINREMGSGAREIFYDNIPNEVKLNNVLELNSIEAIKGCIKGRNYLSCLPKFTLKEELNNGIYEVKVKNINFKRNLNLIYQEHKTQNPCFVKTAENFKEKIAKIHENFMK